MGRFVIRKIDYMQSWQKYFDKTFVLNLEKRTDRKERMIEIFEEYDIEGEIFHAVDIPKSFLGLIETTKRLFEKCLEANFKNVLVLEDDCEFIVSPKEFHLYMTACVEDLKTIDYDIFYLGLQHPRPFLNWKTRNLLPVNMGYSTHALAYSERYMKVFLDYDVTQPLDNWIVEKYQHYGTCFCSYPLLATQRKGFSDINADFIDWNPYITTSYNNAIKEILPLRK